MRMIFVLVLLAFGVPALLAGCGKIDGPRFWWDDRNQQRVADGYQLPGDHAAPSDEGVERAADATGGDLSEDNLRDYRTDLDLKEEKRKSDASLVDF